MAITDNQAFNALEGEERDFITGGAISISEYEQNMTPADQKSYENSLIETFQLAYARDPYRQNLSFKHWLRSLKPELYRERSKVWEDGRAKRNGTEQFNNISQMEYNLLEDAGIIQRLAHLHTGRIEDLVDIVDALAQEQPGTPDQGMQAPMQAPPVEPEMPEDTMFEGWEQPATSGNQGL